MGADYSVGVTGIIPADEKYKKYCEIWQSCLKNELSIPKELYEYFNIDPDGYAVEEPPKDGVEIELETIPVEKDDEEIEECFDIEVAKIPKDVKFIRVTHVCYY